MLDIEFEPVENPRVGYDWKFMGGCSKCGTVVSSYVRVTISYNYCIIVHPFLLCKGCLLEGVKLTDDAIKSQII